jgi:succinyl-diaminopimelate desuccinylase
MDTVPPAGDYTRDPFSVVCDGDIVRGLGVCDMKGGLTCILQAAKWASDNNLPLKVIFGVDEEDISRGAHDLVQSGLLSDVGFMIVAESGQIQDYNQPISVCLGRKGRLVFELEVFGKAAHAAESSKGVNAIEQACRLIQSLATLSFPVHSSLGTTSLVVQGISAQSDSFSVPDRCVFTASLLTAPGMLGSDFMASVLERARSLGIEMKIRIKQRETPYGDAYELDTSNPFYRRVYDTVLRPLGVKPMYTPSVADENVFANRLKIPVLTIGVIGGGDHTGEEWARLSSFETVVTCYTTCISFWTHQATSM